MRRLFPALLVLALAIGALESVLVRLDLHYRPREPALFLQAAILWLALGGLACLPAALSLHLARRLGREPWPPAVLAAWMLLPIVAHRVLDRHTQYGGGMQGLFSLRTALELAGAMLAGLGVLALAARTLRRARGRVLAVVLVGASVLAGLALPWRADDPAPGSAAPAPGDGLRPNLLLLVWDTCRSDRLQPYGFGRPTSPFLERLAGESLVFENSVASAIFTFSSHLTLLTGVYPSTHGGRLVRMLYDPTRATTLAATLRAAGYRTGAFVGTDVLAGRTGIRHGFERYEDQVDPPVCDTYGWKTVHDLQALCAARFPALRNNGEPHWFQRFQRPAEEVLAHALDWIAEPDPRPWFCFVNLYDVHWPYVPDAESARELVGPYDGALDGYLFRSDRWRQGAAITEDDKRHVRELYEAEIHALDRTVALFLDQLELQRGGTAVLLTADHGEAFGEHEQWYHDDIGEVQVRVPFLVRLPEPAPRGERRRAQVGGVDVAPTLLALAGLPRDARMEGRDVLSLAEDEPRAVFVEDRDHEDPADVRVALYEGSFKLVRRGLGGEARYELFDLASDPQARRDVSEREPALLARLRAALEARRASFDAEEGAQSAGGSSQADALRALGYAGDDRR